MLAPVIFGSVCLSCLVQPLPVLAAPASAAAAGMQTGQACAEYKDLEQSMSSGVVVSAANFGVTMISDPGMSPLAKHDASCRLVGNDAVIDTKILPLVQSQAAVAILPLAIPGDLGYDHQSTPLVFYRIKPDKPDLITGCVFKLE